MSAVVDVVVAALVLSGSSLVLVGAIGVQRFDDTFARMHAATKPVTLGLVLVLAGVAVEVGRASVTAELALAALFQFATAPMGMTLIGRSAYDTGAELAPGTEVDELAADRRRDRPEPGPGTAIR